MKTEAEDSDVLSGGEWVRRGLVWRWVPDDPAEAIDEDDEQAIRPHDLIACPTCGARMDEKCQGGGLRPNRDHRRRLVKRVCSCGNSLRQNEPMCGFCRAEMEREEAA